MQVVSARTLSKMMNSTLRLGTLARRSAGTGNEFLALGRS